MGNSRTFSNALPEVVQSAIGARRTWQDKASRARRARSALRAGVAGRWLRLGVVHVLAQLRRGCAHLVGAHASFNSQTRG